MNARSGPAEWRLLIDETPCSGAWNMALDRALQISHAEGESAPVLRLYGWARPTVTLGRFQSADSVELELCRTRGIDVSRRFTGGRGVLHDDEVTYSMVAGLRDGVPRGTAASYRLLCGALVAAHRHLGIDAELTHRPRGTRRSASCYLHATNADLSLGVRKLSGSAQIWYRESVLQHGSVVLARDVEREAAVFRLDERAQADLVGATATVEESTGRRPEPEEVRQAVVEGVSAALGVHLVPASISCREVELARALLAETLVVGPVLPGPEGSV